MDEPSTDQLPAVAEETSATLTVKTKVWEGKCRASDWFGHNDTKIQL